MSRSKGTRRRVRKRELWTRRASAAGVVGYISDKAAKKFTHHVERQKARAQVRKMEDELRWNAQALWVGSD